MFNVFVFVILWVLPFTDRSESAQETKIDSPEEEDVFFCTEDAKVDE